MLLQEAIAQRIKKLIEGNGEDIGSFCHAVGMSVESANRLVAGKNSDAKISLLKKIANHFGLTLVQFFNDELFLSDELVLERYVMR